MMYAGYGRKCLPTGCAAPTADELSRVGAGVLPLLKACESGIDSSQQFVTSLALATFTRGQEHDAGQRYLVAGARDLSREEPSSLARPLPIHARLERHGDQISPRFSGSQSSREPSGTRDLHGCTAVSAVRVL